MSFVFVLLAGAVLLPSHSAEAPGEAARDVGMTHELLTHPTVRCEHIHPVNGQGDDGNIDRACASHCRTLGDGYEGGRCAGGFCQCKRKESPRNPDSHPTAKCTDLIPDEGTSRAENHEACNAHCESLRNGYRKGQCEKGICHCHVRI